MTMRPDVRLSIHPRNGRPFTEILSNGKDRHVIGRRTLRKNTSADILVSDRAVSPCHFEIIWDHDAGWAINDLGAANGTTLDGTRIEAPIPLRGYGKIVIGKTEIDVELDFRDGDAANGGGAAEPAAGTADETAVIPAFLSNQGNSTRVDLLQVRARAGTVSEDENADRETLAIPSPGEAVAPPQETTMMLAESDAQKGTLTLPATDPAPPRPAEDEPLEPFNVFDETTAALANANIDLTEAATALADAAAATVDAPGLTEAMTPEAMTPEAATPAAEDTAAFQPGMKLRGPKPELTGIAIELVAKKFLDEDKVESLNRLARDTGRTFFRALADDASVRFKDEIYKFVADQLGHRLIENETVLRDQTVVVEWLPYALAERRGILMLTGGTEETVRYATVDPFDISLDDWVRQLTDTDANFEKILATPSAFIDTIQRLKGRVSDEEAGEIGVAIKINLDQEREIQNNIDNIDIPQIVNYFLHRGFIQGASDVHVEPTEEMLLVRNRIDGILHEDTSLPANLHREIISRIKIMSGMDVAEKRRPQDGRIGAVIRDVPIDVRVSTYPTVYGEKIAMRLLDKSALRPSPETIGLIERDLRILKDKINAPYGLIMISGPTGSGKTTTLYSCLGSIDKKAKNVLTIEDPVEYRLRGVHQMQVNDKIGLTFASGLRTILRQDPDVVMVGECRDVETSTMAIQASLTGHIVFSTIHTNDAVGVITRLLDMKIDPFLVANALSLGVAQRLVRSVCHHCKTAVLGEHILRDLHNEGVSDDRLAKLGIKVDLDLSYVKGTGCVHCRNTGYHGRQAVFELFEITNDARSLIMSENFNATELQNLVMLTGMTTLITHGKQLVEEGATTHSEVIRVLGETY